MGMGQVTGEVAGSFLAGTRYYLFIFFFLLGLFHAVRGCVRHIIALCAGTTRLVLLAYLITSHHGEDHLIWPGRGYGNILHHPSHVPGGREVTHAAR